MDHKSRRSYGSFARLYDRLMADMPYDRWLEFLLHVTAGESCVRAVELGCGTGTIALQLAGLFQSRPDLQANGKPFSLFAMDVSPDMLAIAEEKRTASLAGAGLESVRFIEADMCELEVVEPVDLVFSFCDSINYLTAEADVCRLFARVHASLRADGLFVFDVLTDAIYRRYAAEHPFIWNEPDLSYIWTCEYMEPLMYHELTIYSERLDAPGTFERIDEQHVQRAYEMNWLVVQLRRAGFRDVQFTADFGKAEVDENTHRLFVVARA